MNKNAFEFKLVEIKPFQKGDKEMARVVCYCSFGYLINLFTTKEKADKLKEKSRQNNFNMSDFVNVFYDNNKQQFAYVINSIN